MRKVSKARMVPFSLLLRPDEKRRYAAAAKDAGQSLGLWLREAAEMRHARLTETSR